MNISKKTKLGIIASILAMTGISGTVYSQSQNVDASKKSTSSTIKLQKFTKIQVNDASNNITIKSGDGYSVYYKGEAKNKPEVVVKDGTLVTKTHNNFGWFNFNWFNNNTGTLVIEVPKTELNNIDVNASNGDILIDSIQLKNGNISTSNGDVIVKNSDVKEILKVDSSNGDVQITNSKFSNYNLSASNGDIDYYGKKISNSYEENSKSKNTLNVDASNGDIILK